MDHVSVRDGFFLCGAGICVLGPGCHSSVRTHGLCVCVCVCLSVCVMVPFCVWQESESQDPGYHSSVWIHGRVCDGSFLYVAGICVFGPCVSQ